MTRSEVRHAPFGRLPDGQSVDLFTLRASGGLELGVITYGCAIVSLQAPDRRGDFADIVLGCDDLDGYLAQTAYFGAVVGRYANRIAGARFTLDGREYCLAANWNGQHLHGGVRGFDKRLWHAAVIDGSDGPALSFTRTSPAGEEGYPGNLEAEVRYALTGSNELIVDYRLNADASTPINLSQHSYFNLAGHDAGPITGHELWIAAHRFTPVDERLIPNGEIADLAGTPFDFRTTTPIGLRIADADPQLARAGGYDHNFVLDRTGPGLAPAAQVFEPQSGRTLTVATTEPGLQFYSGNFLDGSIRGKGGCSYGYRSGLCLETQHFPDSPNVPAFPSTILRPGQPYESRTIFAFSAR
ncbi:MAG: aldose epimerase family protein [Vicinamibacterales bacterium]